MIEDEFITEVESSDDLVAMYLKKIGKQQNNNTTHYKYFNRQ